MTQPAKRVEIVKVHLVKEKGFQYQGRYVNSPRNVMDLVNEHLYMDRWERESFVVVSVNAKCEPTHIEVVSTGSLTASIVHPREVFKMAILSNAHSILCIHNHPSGDPEASSEDRRITKRLKEAGEIIGISVLDHIIVGDNERFYSFKEKGLLL